MFSFVEILIYVVVTVLSVVILFYALYDSELRKKNDIRYQVKFLTKSGTFKIDNIKRGASIIGSAGSGKTESVVYGFLKHFRENGFCGIIHDYKDFELTEMAYPFAKASLASAIVDINETVRT